MRPVDPKLMEILVCPISKKELVQKGDELICIESQLAYPIKNGIPSLFTPICFPTPTTRTLLWGMRLKTGLFCLLH